MIRSLPLTALSLLLGFFFVFIGIIKVTPSVNADIYRDMRQEYGRFNKVFPLYSLTGWRPLAKNYRLTVGLVEVISGAIMVLIPGPLKDLANIFLLISMVFQFYTHYSLGDSFERMAPALIFGLLLMCRLIILLQVVKKEKKDLEMVKKLIHQKKMEGEEQNTEELREEDNEEEEFEEEPITAEDKKDL